jgi:thiol-disulfide isomerase/thioredoxin
MTKKHIKLGKISVPDVRSKKDVPALEKLLNKGPITFVLVYADWCGHCDRYKENVWSPLKSMKHRTSNLASVHYDQLENTSLANAKIDGYPSMLVVGNDKKPAVFNGNSGITNAMPNANDLETMKKVVTAPVPVNSSVSTLNSTNTNLNTLTNVNSLSIPTDVTTQNGRLSPLLTATDVPLNEVNMDVSPIVSSSVSPIVSSSVSPIVSSSVSPIVSTSIPPNVNSDIISNSTNRAVNLNKSRKQTQGTTPLLEGGRLYRSLSSKRKRTRRNNRRKN